MHIMRAKLDTKSHISDTAPAQSESTSQGLGVHGFQRMKQLSTRAMEKACSLHTWFAGLRYHLPSGTRVPPRRFFPVKPQKDFLNTEKGRKIVDIINRYRDAGLFQQGDSSTEAFVCAHLQHEGTHTGDVLAELICNQSGDVSDKEEQQLITYLAACEKLKECADRRVQGALSIQNVIKKDTLTTLNMHSMTYDRVENECRRKITEANLRSLADQTSRMTQFLENNAKRLHDVDCQLDANREQRCELRKALIAECLTSCFPKVSQVSNGEFTELAKTEIPEKLVSKYHGCTDRLLFYFLVVGRDQKAHTALSACIQDGKSYVYMQRKARFVIEGTKETSFEELRKTLESYCGSDDRIEMTAWSQPLSVPDRILSANFEATIPPIMELEAASASPAAVPVVEEPSAPPPPPLPLATFAVPVAAPVVFVPPSEIVLSDVGSSFIGLPRYVGSPMPAFPSVPDHVPQSASQAELHEVAPVDVKRMLRSRMKQESALAG